MRPTTIRYKILVLGALIGAAGCSTEIERNNPMDAHTPAEQQAKATVAGKVLLAGEYDHSSISVIFDGPDARSVDSASDGSFRLTDLQPGTYKLSFSTRYFQPVTVEATVEIAGTLTLDSTVLQPKTADVQGSVSFEDNSNPAGTLITLSRQTSIRTASAGAPLYRTAATATTASTIPVDEIFNGLTDQSGSYILGDIPAGEYALTAWKENKLSQSTVVLVNGDGTVTVPLLTLKPLTGQFSIVGTLGNGDPSNQYTSQRQVTLDLDGFNANTMSLAEVQNDGSCDYATGVQNIDFSATYQFTLSDQDGLHTICAQFYDDLGRSTPDLRGSIVLDRLAPALSSFELGDGSGFATTHSFALQTVASDTHSGVNQMQIGTGGSWQDFVPSVAQAVTADGEYQYQLRLRDAAGNSTGWYSRTITIDTLAPAFNAVLEGSESIAYRTASQVAVLKLDSLSSDVAYMRISNQSSLIDAAWQPVSSQVNWLLLPTDGLKTVYVQVRDHAGNVSTVLSPQITLDQTAPDVPVLLVASVDGDTFALSASEVELSWNIPSDNDLQQFDIERYVYNVDSNFVFLEQLGSVSDQFVDDITATIGNVHSYRIRAIDDLGNTSAWSAIATALPFSSMQRANWVRTAKGIQIDFPPEPGTFSIQGQYSYEDTNQEIQTEVLPYNFTSFKRYQAVQNGEVRWAESLQIQSSNQDNNLVYEQTIPLNINRRELANEAIGSYTFTAMEVDAKGNPHFAFLHPNDYTIVHQYIDEGKWQQDVMYDAPSNWGNVGLDFDNSGTLHSVFVDGPEGKLIYAKKSGDQWTRQLLFDRDNWASNDGYGEVDKDAIVAGDNGEVYIANYNWNDRVLDLITNESGSWVTQTVDSGESGTNQVGEFQNMVRDSSGVFHIVYQDRTNRYPRYAYGTTDGGWTITRFADTADVYGYRNDIAVRTDGSVLISTINSTQTQLELIDNQSGNWVTSVVDINVQNGDFYNHSLVLDSNDRYHIMVYDYLERSLAYVHDVTGSTNISYIESRENYGQYPASGIDRSGKLHAVYYSSDTESLYYITYAEHSSIRDKVGPSLSCAGTDPANYFDQYNQQHISHYAGGSLYYSTFVDGQWVTELVDSGGGDQVGFDSSLLVDSSGTIHISYMNVSDFDLYHAWNDGSGWQTERIGNAGGKVGYFTYFAETAMVEDPDGNLHILYNLAGSGLQHTTNASGSWISSTVHGLYVTEFVSAAIDSSGRIHVAYAYGSSLYYAIKDDAGWTIEQAGTYVQDDASLAITPDGTKAYISFQNYDDSLALATNESGSWSTKVIDNTGRVGRGTSIAIAPDGTIHIHHATFTSPPKIRYANRRNGIWNLYELFNNSDEYNILDGPRSLALDNQGLPSLAYRDNGCGGARLNVAHDYFGYLYPSSTQRTTPF